MRRFATKAVVSIFFSSLIAALLAVSFRVNQILELDPDQYFHFRLSQQMADSSQLFFKMLPQVEGLGWGDYFIDKEFLFHQITALGHMLGGETGIRIGVWLIALSALITFFLYASSRIGPAFSFLATLLFFGSPVILVRLLMVRPHVLAIFFIILLIAGLLRKNRWITGLAALLFALSYHAFYIPVIILLVAAVADILAQKRYELLDKRLYITGFLGLVAGTLLNPYFPANLVSGVQIAFIPSLMAGELSSVGFGIELYPVTSDFLLKALLPPLLVVAAAIFTAGSDQKAGHRSYPVLFLLGISGVFLVMSLQSKRGTEYFIPACAFLFVELMARYRSFRPEWPKEAILFPVIGMIFWQGFQFHSATRGEFSGVQLHAGSISALPEDPGKKVFNCEWDSAPYLYYGRPGLRFIDILDPSLLYFHDKRAHEARELLKKGEIADAYGLIKNSFGADFVLCRNSRINSQLENDPRFRRIFPGNLSHPVSERTLYTYELISQPNSDYVMGYEVSLIQAGADDFHQKGPKDSDGKSVSHRLTHSPYLHLGEIFRERQDGKPNGALCALIRPDGESMSALERATFLAIGGGRNIRLWRNGVPVYDSVSGFPYAQQHQVVVPLKEPIRQQDRLEFVVCSSGTSGYWGLSLLGLTEPGLAKACEWKGAFDLSRKEPPFPFELRTHRRTCLGDLAVPAISSILQ